MSTTPLVSIIMPVYNCAPFITEAVKSMLNQTLQSFELIIIDDCSTDGTADIIGTLNDNRIIFIQKPGKTGLVASLNMGISLARGTYIARMDGDDISHSDRLEKQVEFMETHLEVDLCGSAYQAIGNEEIVYFPVDHEEIKLHLMDFCPVAHPTVMWRKSFSDQYELNYKTEFEGAEDYELWTRAIWLGKMANMAAPLLSYRLHDQQFSNTNKANQDKNSALCRINMLQKIQPGVSSTDPFTREFLFQNLDYDGIDQLNKILDWMDDLINQNAVKHLYEPVRFGNYVFKRKRHTVRRFFSNKTTYSPQVLVQLIGSYEKYKRFFDHFEYLKLLFKCMTGLKLNPKSAHG